MIEGVELKRALETIVSRHYAHCLPSGKRACYAFEDALVLFALPANKNISTFLLGEPNAVWELSRLWAPDGHRLNLLTEAISFAVAAFRRDFPLTKALVSYADPNVGHGGGVYRAASWQYLGQCEESRYYRSASGQVVSRRAFHSGGKALVKAEIEARGFVQLNLPGKHRYARGLSRSARRRISARSRVPILEVQPF